MKTAGQIAGEPLVRVQLTRGRVRAFTEYDIPQVAALHRKVFDLRTPDSSEAYRQYFLEVFLNNPWYDRGMSSLVYEEESGKIGGFLGVVPRPMRIAGSLIQTAVSSQFIVDPESRSRLAGVQLLKKFLSGPQDLSLADEANDASRVIWERLGGSTALLYSIHWTCALRPARFLQLRLAQRRGLEPLECLLTPFCLAFDSVWARWHQPSFAGSPPASVYLEDEPGPAKLLDCYDALWDSGSLRPVYDRASFRWLLGRAANGRPLHTLIVRSVSQRAVGWALYYLDRRGMGEVLQIGSEKASIRLVLDQLFRHARNNGAVALNGRLEAGLMPELFGHRGLFYHRRFWTLVHSARHDVLDAIFLGDAFLTRLDGEWCMRFDKR